MVPRRSCAGRLVVLATVMLVLSLVSACQSTESHPIEVEGGDPDRGRAAIQAYGCGSCHSIPGIERADGRVAPPLTVWGNRAFVAGVMPNNPENVAAFIQDPQEYSPRTAMPDLGVPESDARDIAAYLFTLR